MRQRQFLDPRQRRLRCHLRLTPAYRLQVLQTLETMSLEEVQLRSDNGQLRTAGLRLSYNRDFQADAVKHFSDNCGTATSRNVSMQLKAENGSLATCLCIVANADRAAIPSTSRPLASTVLPRWVQTQTPSRRAACMSLIVFEDLVAGARNYRYRHKLEVMI